MIYLKKIPTTPKHKKDKKKCEEETVKLKEELFILQNLLYAENKHSLLIILQGMDAAGKDGTVRHVFSSINPQGCNVKSFKTPAEEELKHDFLWRVHLHVPAKGMIEIFNRSHYEDILFPTVHKTIDKKIIEKRYEKINRFEKELKDNGTIILKFFLHISKEEQNERIKARLNDPHKRWKYSPSDGIERKNWSNYMKVYEKIIERCDEIPWSIVPADKKWYRNYFIAKEIVVMLRSLKMKYPVIKKPKEIK